jgi:TrmH family RNA methyltransferase
MEQLHRDGVDTVAACLTPDSLELPHWKRAGPSMILLGNEAHGLPDQIIRAATQRIKIAMDLGTDSLNVSVAAGIILHYACRLACPPHGAQALPRQS